MKQMHLLISADFPFSEDNFTEEKFGDDLYTKLFIWSTFTSNPPGTQRRRDISFWYHLGWDIMDHTETLSQRHCWYVNETDYFGTLSRRLTGTEINSTNLRRHRDVPNVT